MPKHEKLAYDRMGEMAAGWHRVGLEDPTFAQGSVPKVNRGSLQPNQRLLSVRAPRIWTKQPKKVGITHFSFVFSIFCTATALRSSEILALRWSDVMWGEGRIRISKRWAKGEDGETKTDVSDGYVPLHRVLAGHLRE